MTRVGDYTPWGPAQHVEQLREGVEMVGTAGHGGLRLSAETAATLPAGFKSFTGHNIWLEEDVDMPMVLWFLRLGHFLRRGHDSRLYEYGENVAKHGDGGNAASNWKALKAERQARMHRSAMRANARIRAARARALAEAAA